MMIKNKPLKVMFSHYGIIDGAGFSRTLPIAKELANLGYNVTLITGQSKGFKFPYRREKRGNLNIISFPDFFPKSYINGGLGILNIILKSIYATFTKFNIVHSDSGHRPSSGLPCIINRLIYKSIYISEWWDFVGKGGHYNNMPKWRRFILGNYDHWAETHNRMIADGVIVLSEYTKNRAIKLGIKNEKLTIIHGGSDIENIKYIDNINFRKNFGIDMDCLLFGFIGINEEEVNNLAPFIQAIQGIKKYNNVKWFTTGAKLNKQTKLKFNIEDELYEFGWINYSIYSELLSCANVFLLLQQSNLVNEARFPNKLGDYLAAGRLILTNGFGETNYYVNNYPESFVKVSWNVIEIQNAIQELYDQKKWLIKKGLYCREVAVKSNSWKSKAIEVEIFYNKILNI